MVLLNEWNHHAKNIFTPTFWHSGLVFSSGVIWCRNSWPYILSRWRHLPTSLDVNILVLNNFRHSYLRHLNDIVQGDSAVKGFATVPYIQEIAEPIRRVLNSCGIKVALKPFRTLGHIFAKPKVSFAHVWRNIKGLFLTPTGQNQLWLNTREKQAITLRGMILESLPLTIVMFNGFVWKPGILTGAIVS